MLTHINNMSTAYWTVLRMFVENMTSAFSHLILATRVKYSSGTDRLNLDNRMKLVEYIVSGRNILAVYEIWTGFPDVQSHYIFPPSLKQLTVS